MLETMALRTASSRVLVALAIFALGFTGLGSANEHLEKPKDHSIAPKVFIIDMV